MNKLFKVITLLLSLVIFSLTIKTITTGVILLDISERNTNSESYRTTEIGSLEADKLYSANEEIRHSIYNSKDHFVKWLSTTNRPIQFLVGITLALSSSCFIYIWYLFILNTVKKLKKKKTRKITYKRTRAC